uniref:Uncharacterized protein n=1 Tax=Anoplophora glabripennis TaxID=217634 RepID=V5GGY0_ANOGL
MSDDEEQTAALLVLCGGALLLSSLLNKKRKFRRWARTALYKKRSGSQLLEDLKFQHISGQNKNFTRMSPTDFENLLNKIGPAISKRETHFQQPISIQDR